MMPHLQYRQYGDQQIARQQQDGIDPQPVTEEGGYKGCPAHETRWAFACGIMMFQGYLSARGNSSRYCAPFPPMAARALAASSMSLLSSCDNWPDRNPQS